MEHFAQTLDTIDGEDEAGHQFSHLIAEWPGHHAVTGDLVAWHGRFECDCAECTLSGKPAKQFRWRLDGKTWAGGLGGHLSTAQLALYGADEVSPSEPVVITEGEAAADALIARGVQAVGTMTGARALPGNDALCAVADCHVLLWPDNDETGRKHMDRLASQLAELGCGDIRVVNWDAAPASGDAADFDRTDEELNALLAEAQTWRPMLKGGTQTKPLSTVSMRDVVAERVEFLAEPYIALGKLTIVEGDPGVGKSHVLCSLAAAVSNGWGFPGMDGREPANVLLMSAEDGLADTVRPRLDRMLADTSRVFAVDELFTLANEGIARLEGAIRRHHPLLVIIDPLVAYLGGKVDMHRANEVRDVLAPLTALAAQYECAIVACRHLTKAAGGRAIYRGQGSIDFTAAARSVILVGVDPADSDNRALVQTKNNLGPFGISQGFAIRDGWVDWTGETELTADDLLGGGEAVETPGALDEAMAFVEMALADGPLPASELQSLAEFEGISSATLKRARKALDIKGRRVGEPGRQGGGQWIVGLPATS